MVCIMFRVNNKDIRTLEQRKLPGFLFPSTVEASPD